MGGREEVEDREVRQQNETARSGRDHWPRGRIRSHSDFVFTFKTEKGQTGGTVGAPPGRRAVRCPGRLEASEESRKVVSVRDDGRRGERTAKIGNRRSEPEPRYPDTGTPGSGGQDEIRGTGLRH